MVKCLSIPITVRNNRELWKSSIDTYFPKQKVWCKVYRYLSDKWFVVETIHVELLRAQQGQTFLRWAGGAYGVDDEWMAIIRQSWLYLGGLSSSAFALQHTETINGERSTYRCLSSETIE